MGTGEAAGRARERERRMRLTTLVSAAARAAGIGVNLAVVPLALGYLGIEQYGLWLVLITMVAWLGFAQLGMASSLLNHLASAEGRADGRRAAGLVASAWWLQVAVAGALIAVVAALLPILPLGRILNAPEGMVLGGLRGAALVLWLGFLLGLPGHVTTAVFQAKQEGYIAHGWDLLRSALRLGSIIAVVRTDWGVVGLAAAHAVPSLLVSAAAAAHLFLRHRSLAPRIAAVRAEIARPLMRTGLQFTGLTFAALVISSTDNIVIAHVLGPAHVPAYAATFMVVQLFITVEMLALDAAWPAYTEAAARGDGEWVRRTHFRLVRWSLAGAVLFGILLVAAGQPLVRLWAGESIVPPQPLLWAMALLVVIQSGQLCFGRLTTALGAVGTNMLLGLANAAVNLPASILLAGWIGLPGVALGTVLGYTVISVPLVVLSMRALATLSPASPPRTGLGAAALPS